MSDSAPRLADLQLSLADVAQDYLRDQIMSGALTPGERIKERELSDVTGISRIPIREALQRLAAEGFVTPLPRRGATVSQIEPDDLDEIFEVRIALEVQECMLAVAKATEREVADLLATVARAERALAAGDRAAVDAENAAFHDLLVKMSHNDVLQSMLKPLRSRLTWLLRQNDDVQVMCTEHSAIARAIADRDAEQVRVLALSHVETSKRLALAQLFRRSSTRSALPTADAL